MPSNKQRSRADVLERLDSHHKTACSAERELLHNIVECDRASVWEADGGTSFVEWLAERHGISNWKSRRLIEAAHALESLPHIASALSSGLLNLDKTIELAHLATPTDEDKLIEWAQVRSARAIRRHAERRRRSRSARALIDA